MLRSHQSLYKALKLVVNYFFATLDKLAKFPPNRSNKQVIHFEQISFSQTYRLQPTHPIHDSDTNTRNRKMKVRNWCGTQPVSDLNPLEAQSPVEGRSRRCTGSRLPWVISTIYMACLALYLFAIRINSGCRSTLPAKGSFEAGFSTDLGR